MRESPEFAPQTHVLVSDKRSDMHGERGGAIRWLFYEKTPLRKELHAWVYVDLREEMHNYTIFNTQEDLLTWGMQREGVDL